MESKRVICPVCGDDLGPAQPFMSTLTGCRRCRVWVNNAGELVKDPHEYFKRWKEQKCPPKRLNVANVTSGVTRPI